MLWIILWWICFFGLVVVVDVIYFFKCGRDNFKCFSKIFIIWFWYWYYRVIVVYLFYVLIDFIVVFRFFVGVLFVF